MERAGVKFLRGEVLVVVKGGEVVTGGAPLDLILRKVEEIRALIYRTAEFLISAPHRKRGPANEQIQQICRPWLFQAATGSYQFAVRVQEPAQIPMFPEVALKVEEVTPKLLQILRASAEDPEGTLPQVMPDLPFSSLSSSQRKQVAYLFADATFGSDPDAYVFTRWTIRERSPEKSEK